MNVSSDIQLELSKYFASFNEVEGWLSPTTALMMAETVIFQGQEGISGQIIELGIHHGKSFLPLAIASSSADDLVAIDCFEHQEFNVDFSGSGNRDIFIENMARFAPEANYRIVDEDSLKLLEKLSLYQLGNARLFSVDASHTRMHTRNDLMVADACLNENGICVLDDILSPHWTGVISGLFDFLSEKASLAPLAFFPNKLVLCRPSKSEFYAEWYAQQYRTCLEKRGVELFNWRVDAYGEIPSLEWSQRDCKLANRLSLELQELREQLATKRPSIWSRLIGG